MSETKKTDPGWKTSEGWLTAAVMVLSMLYALGVVGDGAGTADKIAAFATSLLATLGYTVQRTKAKTAEATKS